MSEVTYMRAWPRDALGNEVAIYLAGGGTHRAYRLADQQYRAGMVNRPRFRAAVGFDANGFTGAAVPTASAIGFTPADPGVADTLLALAWKDVRVEIDGGDEDGAIERLLTCAGQISRQPNRRRNKLRGSRRFADSG